MCVFFYVILKVTTAGKMTRTKCIILNNSHFLLLVYASKLHTEGRILILYTFV
uniref:Uncharacterized protein n=1 Tax=Arundo donax TaxID=35708 RepID=A0A0A9F979_ARUDO